ncbi:MAG: hypothetical protein NC181_02225 [Clostridium sp.]|nr:hypothetical protein [Clostridium sp.]MCM1443701.1 hypothetical protein [Candidatus Amulumruptor caecigallinarius]
MKKVLFLTIIIISIILIYTFTKVKGKAYLILGVNDNDIYIQEKVKSLQDKFGTLNYNTKFLDNNYRITDIINDIKFQKEIDGKTILNYIIKADYITLNVGYNDFNVILQNDNMYENIDKTIRDLEELFKLVRTYSKEEISFIRLNVNDEINEYLDYHIENLCDKYKILYIE